MPSWILNNNLTMPTQFSTAFRSAMRRVSLDRYRSRSAVSDELIRTAYSWTQLMDNSGVSPNRRVRYVTRALARGVTDAEAVQEALAELNTIFNVQGLNVITITSYTNATAETALCESLSNSEDWVELNVRTMVTTSPAHRIKLFKSTRQTPEEMYVIITNVYTDAVVFKTAAAISLDVNYIPELNPGLQEGLLTGDAEKVYTVLTAYYAEFAEAQRRRQMEEALRQIEDQLTNASTRTLDRVISNLETEADSLYDRYKTTLRTLKEKQVELLMYKLQGNEEIVKPVVQLLSSCKDKITRMYMSGSYLNIYYVTPLTFWETKYYDAYVSSTRGNAITNMPRVHQALFKEIFKDRTIQLMIESGVSLNVTQYEVLYSNPLTERNVNYSDLKGIPNPHHHYYNCWGDNKPAILKALKNNNYVQALTQVFAAMGGINLTDSAVMNRFCNDAMSTYRDTPCLRYKETGEVITIREYERRYADVSNQND